MALPSQNLSFLGEQLWEFAAWAFDEKESDETLCELEMLFV
jgi:hypothetical protein